MSHTFEHVQEAVKFCNKLIYILSLISFRHVSPSQYIAKLEDEINLLIDINNELEIEFKLSELDKWPSEIKGLLSSLIK